ncbi:MAG: recombinase family protein [Desulfovibrio sp.]|nr:recombinase family protein [Desulfovibrio sp.]
MEYGYIRVSADVDEASQRMELNVPEDRLYIDSVSVERPQLRRLLLQVGQGDVVLVRSMDRLATNLKDLASLCTTLQHKGVEVRFVKEKLTLAAATDDPTTTLFVRSVNAMIAWDRALRHERQAEGFAQAKRAGVRMGRPTSITEHQREMVRNAFRKDMACNVAQLSRETGVPPSSCRDIRKRLAEAMEKQTKG